jgi:DNA polymerase III alpha subunit
MDRQISLNLRDRTLWYDGDSSMSADRMADILLSGKSIDGIFPLEIDTAVKKFNLVADRKLRLKPGIRALDVGYTIPDKYLNINLRKYFLRKLSEVLELEPELSLSDVDSRIARVHLELEKFSEYGIESLIKTVIYIVDTFNRNGIVWGTGRGSSCACYCLYLTGLHDVDSVLYDLQLNEFFR